MNNIEILEEKIKIIESLCIDDCINKSTVIQPLKYAIENLIQENKELKEKNKILESLLQGNLFEMYKYYKELCNSYQGNSVSKDKIKEILKKDRDCMSLGYYSAYIGLIDDIQRLLYKE